MIMKFMNLMLLAIVMIMKMERKRIEAKFPAIGAVNALHPHLIQMFKLEQDDEDEDDDDHDGDDDGGVGGDDYDDNGQCAPPTPHTNVQIRT